MSTQLKGLLILIGFLLVVGVVGLWVLIRHPPAPWTARERLGPQAAALVEEFAAMPYPATFPPLDAPLQRQIDGLLQEALDAPENDFAMRMNRARETLRKATAADAPQGRALYRARTKLALAETLALGDLQRAADRAGFSEALRRSDFDWKSENAPPNREFFFTTADDILAVDQTLPLLISGIGFQLREEWEAAHRAFTAVLRHREAGSALFGEGFFTVAGPTYATLVRLAEEELHRLERTTP